MSVASIAAHIVKSAEFWTENDLQNILFHGNVFHSEKIAQGYLTFLCADGVQGEFLKIFHLSDVILQTNSQL